MRKLSRIINLTIAFTAAALSGINFNVIGVLYVGDIFCLVATGVAIISLFGSKLNLRITYIVTAIVLSMPFIFMCLDVANGILITDSLRGFARNLVFGCAILVGIALAAWRGVELLVWIIFTLGMSDAAWYWATDGRTIDVFTFFINDFKYHNLLMIAIPIYWIAVRSWLVGLTLLSGFGFVLLITIDYRSGFALIWLPALFLLTTRLVKWMGAKLAAAVLVTAVTSVVMVGNTLLTDDRYFSGQMIARREVSNLQRMEMLRFAWDGISQHPLLGNGSWSNAEKFVSSYDTGYYSVHSAIFQLAFEYGALGAIYALAIAVLLIAVVPVIIEIQKLRGLEAKHLPMVMFCWAWATYNCAMGGILGYTRLLFGLMIGMCIYMLLWRSQSQRLAETRYAFNGWRRSQVGRVS